MKINKRKDGRYRVAIQYDGKRKYFIGKDKKDVEARAIEYINLHNKGISLYHEGITVSSLAKEWFELCQNNNEKSTQKRVKGILDNYIVKYLGNIPLKNLKPLQIQKMLNDIQVDHTDTTRKTFQIMKAMLEYAINNDYIYKNVAKSCTINQYKSKEKSILSREEIDILETSNNKYRDFFVFLLYTGMRRGEIAALKWSDIDFQKREIHVSKSMSFLTNKGTLKATKTNKDRIIPILDKTLKILESRNKKGIYVFTKADGSNLSEIAIKRMHESILKDTGLHFKLHELRHTFCTILYYADVSSINAAQIMGHSISVMQDIYTHLDQDKTKLEIVNLNNYIENRGQK